MTGGSMGRPLAAVAVALSSLVPSMAWARRPKPPACPGGVFTFAPADAAALEQAIGQPASAFALTITSRLLADCSGTARVKGGRKGTSFKAKLTGCGVLAKLKIRGTIATPACSEIHAKLAGGRGKKLQLAATRGLPPTTHELIARALAEGRIDYPTSLAYRPWADVLDPQLPPEFDVRRDVAERRCPNYWTHLDATVANVRVWDCSSGDAAAGAAFLGRIAALFDQRSPVHTR